MTVTNKASVLFVNYAVENCGVHQYGKNLFNAISKSLKYQFHYIAVSGLSEIDGHVSKFKCDAIIYNYHPQTLPFINPHMTRRFRQVNIAIMHEMTQLEADTMPNKFFQYYVMGDPTLEENNPFVFKTGRLILPYKNEKRVPDIVTIGTFGFSVGSKGYQRLIDVVQEEFDEAIIRIHVPSNGIVDPQGFDADLQIKLCQQRIRKPGIKIPASRDFLDQKAMLDFLAENTVNAFLYDYLKVAGISSSIDHAMAVQRPIAITKSVMFRHMLTLSPPITIEDISLKQIIRNGTAPFDRLVMLWSEENMMREYETILDKALSKAPATQKSKPFNPENPMNTFNATMRRNFAFIGIKLRSRLPKLMRSFRRILRFIQYEILLGFVRYFKAGSFNRILDNKARAQYKSVIQKLHALVPEMMANKIPEANVQQAFVFDTVQKYSTQFVSPRILCVGSHEDTAAAGLKKLGYQLEEIDPMLNNLDLNTFSHHPSTVKGSYHIIFSTSVIEHVRDDELFMTQLVELLAPGGVAILTCDYNDQHKAGQPIIQGNYRFYTKKDLALRILPLLKGCSLVDQPHWDCPKPDFELGGYYYTFATLVFRKINALVIERNWAAMSPSEQRSFFCENGFLVVRNAISPDKLAEIHRDIKSFGFKGTTEDIWASPSLAPLIENDKVLSALQSILGEEVRFFKGAYVETPPIGIQGKLPQRKALHVDYGIGENIGDTRNSCASWINVGYYLTDLTPEHSPLWVVPGSNRNYHISPAEDMEHLANEAKMVLAKAGDAVLFHCFTVHAASLNVSNSTRRALFYSYRPAWAKPIGIVPEWPKEFVDRAPQKRRLLLLGLNQGL